MCREKGVPFSPSQGEGAPRCQGRLKGARTGKFTHPFRDQSPLYLPTLQSRCLSVKHNVTLYSPGCSSLIALVKTCCPLCHRGPVTRGGTRRPLCSPAGARQPGGRSSLRSLALHPRQPFAADFTAKPPSLLEVHRLLLLFK